MFRSIKCPQRGGSSGAVLTMPASKQVEGDPIGKAGPQSLVDRQSFCLRTGRVPRVLVQACDHGRVNVLTHHQFVAEVECRRVDPPRQQFGRVRKVRPVVRDRAAVREVDGHSVTPTGPTGPLPVVGRQWRHVAHQHGVQLTDVDASSRVGVHTNVLIASDSPLNRFSSRSRSSCGTMAVCSSGRSIE